MWGRYWGFVPKKSKEVSALSTLYLHVSDHDSDVHDYWINGETQGQLPKFTLAVSKHKQD